MTLLWFDIIATLIYAASMVCLLHEFRALTPEARHERQNGTDAAGFHSAVCCGNLENPLFSGNVQRRLIGWNMTIVVRQWG